jgi:hypothetical protein
MVYSVGHGATAEHPSLPVHLMLTVGTGSVQVQWAVRVDMMAHGGQVQEKGQTVSVAVTVGQMPVVRAGTMEVMAWGLGSGEDGGESAREEEKSE